MMKSIHKTFLLVLVGLLIVPQITFAAWWNPFSWNIWKVSNRQQNPPQTEVQKINQPSEIEKLRSEVEELKKKTNTPAVIPPKSTTPTSGVTKSLIPVTTPGTKLSNSQIIAKIKPSTVYIETQSGAGSGMIFSTDGYVLTNAHVVKGYTYIDISISSGETLSGKVVGRDEEADLAVVKITSDQIFPKVNFGDSSKTEQGEEVFTLGFPFGIKGDVSFKEGTISRRIESYFETSAEIHPGNSGGPLVNRYGQVIGVNTAIYGKSVAGLQLGETIKLAIPINTANNLIADLKAGRNIVVESQKEKQARQEAVNKSVCLAESEQYYKNLVISINQLNTNDSNLQDLLSRLDQEIENIKRSRDSDVANITREWDSSISQQRAITERRIQAIQTSGIRSGSQYSPGVWSGVVDAERAEGDRQISALEAQKQSFISQAQLSSNAWIQKYEDLKTKARSDREKSTQDFLAYAKTKKVEYYNECMSK